MYKYAVHRRRCICHFKSALLLVLAIIIVIITAKQTSGGQTGDNIGEQVNTLSFGNRAHMSGPLPRRDWRECVVNIGSYFMSVNLSRYYWRGDADDVVKIALSGTSGRNMVNDKGELVMRGVVNTPYKMGNVSIITQQHNIINPFCLRAFQSLSYPYIRSELLFRSGLSEITGKSAFTSANTMSNRLNHSTASVFSVAIAGDSLALRGFVKIVNNMGEPVKVGTRKVLAVGNRWSVVSYDPPFKKNEVNDDGFPLPMGSSVPVNMKTITKSSPIPQRVAADVGRRSKTNIVFIKLKYISEGKFKLPKEIMNMCRAVESSGLRPGVMFITLGNWDMNWKIQKETNIPHYTGPRTLQGATEYWTTHAARLFASIDLAIKTCEEHGPGNVLETNEEKSVKDKKHTNTNINNISKSYPHHRYTGKHKGIPPLIIFREQFLVNCAASRFARKSRSYRQCIPVVRPVIIPLYRRILSAVSWSFNIPMIPTDHLDNANVCLMDDGVHLSEECMNIEQQHYWNVYRLMLREWIRGHSKTSSSDTNNNKSDNLPPQHTLRGQGERDASIYRHPNPFYIHSGVRQGLMYTSVASDMPLGAHNATTDPNSIILDWLTLKTKEFVNVSQFYDHLDRLRVWRGDDDTSCLYSVGDYYSWQLFPTAYGSARRTPPRNQPPSSPYTSSVVSQPQSTIPYVWNMNYLERTIGYRNAVYVLIGSVMTVMMIIQYLVTKY
eukprot:Tbor_TRINITY_DN5440_c0_g1::TRINITY_DN5440_c0_g1_i1::g.24353::m.24353